MISKKMNKEMVVKLINVKFLMQRYLLLKKMHVLVLMIMLVIDKNNFITKNDNNRYQIKFQILPLKV